MKNTTILLSLLLATAVQLFKAEITPEYVGHGVCRDFENMPYSYISISFGKILLGFNSISGMGRTVLVQVCDSWCQQK
jgi:hypothetical protein